MLHIIYIVNSNNREKLSLRQRFHYIRLNQFQKIVKHKKTHIDNRISLLTAVILYNKIQTIFS